MKRIFLISLLLVVLLGFSASAFEPLEPQFKPTLTVELEVDPEKIMENQFFWAGGGKFWVDVYLTPTLKEYITNTQIMLLTSSGDLHFTGQVEQGEINGQADPIIAKVDNSQGGSRLVLSSQQGDKYVWALQGKRKLARVGMAAKKPGNYKIELLKDEGYPLLKSHASYSLQSGQEYFLYMLSMSPVTVCLPLNKCPNAFDCGYKDNGCGKILACNVCNKPKYCVDNVCTDSVIVAPDPDITLCKTVLATASHEKTLLEKIASALKQYKDYKIEFSEITTALVEWFKAAKQPQP